MSSVTVFELQCGAVTERHAEDIGKLAKWIGTIPFDDEIAGIIVDNISAAEAGTHIDRIQRHSHRGYRYYGESLPRDAEHKAFQENRKNRFARNPECGKQKCQVLKGR